MVNALYILKLSSYKFSSVPFAISTPRLFNFSLSSSSKKPSTLFTLGNTPSFSPTINIIFVFLLLDLSISPIIT